MPEQHCSDEKINFPNITDKIKSHMYTNYLSIPAPLGLDELVNSNSKIDKVKKAIPENVATQDIFTNLWVKQIPNSEHKCITNHRDHNNNSSLNCLLDHAQDRRAYNRTAVAQKFHPKSPSSQQELDAVDTV